jgi:Fe-S cluster biogenesis protein NfuA
MHFINSLVLAVTVSLSRTTHAFTIQSKCSAQMLSHRRSNAVISPSSFSIMTGSSRLSATEEDIISPFDSDVNTSTNTESEFLELTWENVEKVLDEMRPYLIQDGGNVSIADIDGPVVRLQLEGACGTCPSSTQTMKMGLERGLKEKIPEIQEVVQQMPQGPELCEEQVEVILAGVRPFLQVAGGTIELESIQGESSIQPCINLKMEGSSASLNSVKLEISQRLQRHFMIAGLQVEWL